MIIVDTALKMRAEEGRPIKVGLVGVGTMGAGIVNQIINSVPGMEIAAIANRTPGHAVKACEVDGAVEQREVSTLDALSMRWLSAQ